jgi:hypothetical protein
MKKIIVLAVAIGAFVLAGNVMAGSGCCPSSKSKKSAEYSSCTKALSGMELTAEQRAKIDAIEAECKEQGMTVDACSKSMSKIRDVLTDDQKASFDAATAVSGGSKAGCGS